MQHAKRPIIESRKDINNTFTTKPKFDQTACELTKIDSNADMFLSTTRGNEKIMSECKQIVDKMAIKTTLIHTVSTSCREESILLSKGVMAKRRITVINIGMLAIMTSKRLGRK
jgi:hypothetical protein